MVRLRDLIRQNEEWLNVLTNIENELIRLFGPLLPSDPYTPHGLSHARKVEEYIDLCVSDDKKQKLTDNEIFYLLASVYLHDIGMAMHKDVLILNPNPLVQKFVNDSGMWDKDLPCSVSENILTIVRNYHSKATMQYIRNYGERLGFKDGFSKYIVAMVCGLHTEKWLPSRQLLTLERSNRVLTLSALLRLGDILHSDYSRIEYERLHIEVFPNLPPTSWIHWAKHLLLQKVIPKPSEGIIELLFVKPLETRESLIFNDIIRKICFDIQQEIDRTRSTLHHSGLTTYFIVNANIVENSKEHGPLTREEERRIIFSLNQYQISRQISATGVEKSLLLSIEDIVLNRTWNLSAYQSQVLQPITSLFEFAYESYHGNRKIKAIGNTIIEILRSSINKISASNINNEKEIIAEIKRKISQELNHIMKEKEAAICKIRQIAKKSPKLRLNENDCILLFSCSTTVTECLKDLCEDLNFPLKILVAECRNKCIVPFSDAIAYVNKLSEFGLNMDIRFISDASIGYYMTNKNSDFKITRAFLGIGDGWVNRSKHKFWIVNTVGSRIITQLARAFNIQVAVFTESLKFSLEALPSERCRIGPNYYIDENDPSIEKLLENLKNTSFNAVALDPVQDRISSEEIDLLITDQRCYSREEFKTFVSSICDCTSHA